MTDSTTTDPLPELLADIAKRLGVAIPVKGRNELKDARVHLFRSTFRSWGDPDGKPELTLASESGDSVTFRLNRHGELLMARRSYMRGSGFRLATEVMRRWPPRASRLLQPFVRQALGLAA